MLCDPVERPERMKGGRRGIYIPILAERVDMVGFGLATLFSLSYSLLNRVSSGEDLFYEPVAEGGS